MKILDNILRSKLFKTSLRFKVMVVFIFPMILILSVLSYIHNIREQRELEQQIQRSTTNLGDMALSGMRLAMLRNDRDVVERILKNIGSNPSIAQMRIVDPNLRIAYSTDDSEIGESFRTNESGCIECHKFPPADRPRVWELRIGEDVMRVVSPISNDEDCQACHPPKDVHLGVLIIDAPMSEIAEHMQEDQLYNASISLFSLLTTAVIAYLLIQWLVVKRVGVLYKYLNEFAAGDFSVRIPKIWRTEDEITQLGDHFNQIAANLETLRAESEAREQVRALAIMEERERIARELHDGVAQFLAYLSAKIGATRLELKNDRINNADKNLQQAEESIREQSLEVRSSIIGLKMAGAIDEGLAYNVREFVEQSNRLGGIVLQLDISDEAADIKMDSEKELQLLRILQEAISNVRKHSGVREASVRMDALSNQFTITIQDNGRGFDPLQIGLQRVGHFGLQIIFERAREIGARVEIKSARGEGTTVTVTMDLPETGNAHTGG